eukprot:TRINITY_DN4994_c0_g1_i2.p1 TRINITY_DN4994_c0_g1~~TRINITY_DN4994_c0_g1_i2.p1  ORF type:complete len:368 (+),score=99.93 TRINITY_DN4994_c0_g1_i2:91-1194(+)
MPPTSVSAQLQRRRGMQPTPAGGPAAPQQPRAQPGSGPGSLFVIFAVVLGVLRQLLWGVGAGEELNPSQEFATYAVTCTPAAAALLYAAWVHRGQAIILAEWLILQSADAWTVLWEYLRRAMAEKPQEEQPAQPAPAKKEGPQHGGPTPKAEPPRPAPAPPAAAAPRAAVPPRAAAPMRPPNRPDPAAVHGAQLAAAAAAANSTAAAAAGAGLAAGGDGAPAEDSWVQACWSAGVPPGCPGPDPALDGRRVSLRYGAEVFSRIHATAALRWPSVEMQMKGGQNGWGGWRPEPNTTGRVAHYWLAVSDEEEHKNNPLRKCYMNRALALVRTDRTPQEYLVLVAADSLDPADGDSRPLQLPADGDSNPY